VSKPNEWNGIERRVDSGDLVEWTAKIVIGALAQPRADITDVPGLIDQVHGALARLGGGKPTAQPARAKPVVEKQTKAEPIMDPEAAISREHITCLECGKKMQIAKPHLRRMHNLTPEQYRRKFSLRDDYPMVAQAASEMAARRARTNLARRPVLKIGGEEVVPAKRATG
jgi:predicted transcriptional regulator